MAALPRPVRSALPDRRRVLQNLAATLCLAAVTEAQPQKEFTFTGKAEPYRTVRRQSRISLLPHHHDSKFCLSTFPANMTSLLLLLHRCEGNDIPFHTQGAS